MYKMKMVTNTQYNKYMTYKTKTRFQNKYNNIKALNLIK